MPYSILRSLVFAAALGFAPIAAFAQEVFGTISATVDGQDRTWFLTTQADESQSFGLTMAIANLQSFNLWGQASDQRVYAPEDSLLLKFDVMSVGGQVVPLNVSVMYLADGWKSGWLADQAEDAASVIFSLKTLENDGSGVLVEGSFKAAAGFAEPLSNGVTDATRTQQIDGVFKAVLPLSLIKTR